MALNALDVIRPVMKVGSVLAPGVTGRVAFRLFCRTQRPAAIGDRQRAMIDRAEERLVEAQRVDVAHAGGAVATYTFPAAGETERGVVLLVHGWTGRAAFMSSFIDPLRACGFRVVAVDLPGHGRSSGRTLHVPLAIGALSAVHAATGPWHGLVGHSFGGLVATSLIAGGVNGHAAIPLQRLVLIAAPESAKKIFGQFGKSIGLNARAQSAYEGRVLTVAGQPIEAFSGAEQLRQAQVPTLILHAPDDKEVDFASAEAFARAGDFVTVRPLPGLGHRRILYAPQSVAQAVAHLASRNEELNSAPLSMRV